MKLTPQMSLGFDGQCEAAFKAYERILNGSISFMLTWGDSPMAESVPPGWAAKICHATISVGDVEMSGADMPPGRYERPQGFSIVLQMDDPDAAERVFESLAEGGRVDMPIQETFWAPRFGVLVDRFGIPWSINCERG